MMYNLDEVFEIAEQIERNGAKFYRVTADRFGDSEAGNLLTQLAEWEDEHEIVFARLRDKFVSSSGGIEYDPDGEAASYLRSIAGSHVFNVAEDTSATLTGKETLKDIFKIALGRERDSIAYFVGVKELVPEGDGREHVDKIIKEEMGHIKLLNERMSEMNLK